MTVVEFRNVECLEIQLLLDNVNQTIGPVGLLCADYSTYFRMIKLNIVTIIIIETFTQILISAT